MLKERPDLRKDLGPTKAQNTYGQRMTVDVKTLVTKLLKAESNNNSENIWFRNVLLDLIDYGDVNTDIAMAYGIVLLYKLEMFDQIIEEDDEYDNDGDNIFDSMSYYDIDSKGNVVNKSYSGLEIDSIQNFNPDIHLSDYDKQDMLRKRNQYKKELEETKKQFESKRKTTFEDLIQQEILRSIKHS